MLRCEHRHNQLGSTGSNVVWESPTTTAAKDTSQQPHPRAGVHVKNRHCRRLLPNMAGTGRHPQTSYYLSNRKRRRRAYWASTHTTHGMERISTLLQCSNGNSCRPGQRRTEAGTATIPTSSTGRSVRNTTDEPGGNSAYHDDQSDSGSSATARSRHSHGKDKGTNAILGRLCGRFHWLGTRQSKSPQRRQASPDASARPSTTATTRR